MNWSKSFKVSEEFKNPNGLDTLKVVTTFSTQSEIHTFMIHKVQIRSIIKNYKL